MTFVKQKLAYLKWFDSNLLTCWYCYELNSHRRILLDNLFVLTRKTRLYRCGCIDIFQKEADFLTSVY